MKLLILYLNRVLRDVISCSHRINDYICVSSAHVADHTRRNDGVRKSRFPIFRMFFTL